jgi:hypothetical protein
MMNVQELSGRQLTTIALYRNRLHEEIGGTQMDCMMRMAALMITNNQVNRCERWQSRLHTLKDFHDATGGAQAR